MEGCGALATAVALVYDHHIAKGKTGKNNKSA